MKNKAGLTLIELLVTVSIIGILSVVALITLNPIEQLKKGADVERKSDLELIQRALEEFYNDNGVYPFAGGGNTIAGIAWGTRWPAAGEPVYMRIIPKDPKSNIYDYKYVPVPGNQSYRLYAYLERDIRDPQRCNLTTCPFLIASPVSCGAQLCNYGVSSSNIKP